MSVKDEGDATTGGDAEVTAATARRRTRKDSRPQSRSRRYAKLSAIAVAIFLCGAGIWLSVQVIEAKNHLSAVSTLLPNIDLEGFTEDNPEVRKQIGQIREHTGAALVATSDPVWSAASVLPILGPNLQAVRVIAATADSLANEAIDPLSETAALLRSGRLSPVDGRIDLETLEDLAPRLDTAAASLEGAIHRLDAIEKRYLASEINVKLERLDPQLRKASEYVSLASKVARALPSAMGSDEPRNYLVLVQNNAEIRATGGLPGSLAVIRVENGHISLSSQASAVQLGKFVPKISVDQEQEQIYTSRLGAYISDVNLTPDFPTAAQTAKRMWEARYGTPIDGVVAIDPLVMAHLLAVFGPLPLDGFEGPREATQFPESLTADDVVPTLLSSVYATLDGQTQDRFFAFIGERFFQSLVTGETPAAKVFHALHTSVEENRLHAWSADDSEQGIIASTELGGSMISGPHAGPSSFGVFFNDGTGAKMDYYVKREVQLVRACRQGNYQETTVRVTSTNTLLAEEVPALSPYVTGGGTYAVTPGSVQTNVVVYGPGQATVETAELDGARADFASHRHGERPVAVFAVKLAPGQTSTVEFTFGQLGQYAEPELLVTPTVQEVSEVILPTREVSCGPGN